MTFRAAAMCCAETTRSLARAAGHTQGIRHLKAEHRNLYTRPLMAGELDIIPALQPEFTTTVPKFAVVSGLETSVIILSTDNKATSDMRVRQALNYAIDRQALAACGIIRKELAEV